MPPLVPPRFLVRVAHPCKYVKAMPRSGRGELLDLPAACRIDTFAALDGATDFADVRLAWNDLGIGVQAYRHRQGPAAAGRRQSATAFRRPDPLARHAGRPHQPPGEPVLPPVPFPRGRGRPGPRRTGVRPSRRFTGRLQDAPLAAASAVPFRCGPVKGGYRIEAFLPAAVLNGFDPEEHPRLGFYYAVRDAERGEQTPGVGAEFPYAGRSESVAGFGIESLSRKRLRRYSCRSASIGSSRAAFHAG